MTPTVLLVALAAAARGPEVLHIATGDRGVLITVGSTTVYNSGYGSAMARVPGSSRDFYLLTDRGPNLDYADGKAFPVPTFTPRIWRVRLDGDRFRVTGSILLRRPDGIPRTGLPNPPGAGGTGEVPYDLAGNALSYDPGGLDSEGLVAMRDGSFWISDEYGPHLIHFDAKGRELERLNPFNGGLPAVYARRRRNGGMEGLTITPDGQTLVGIMQMPLENPGSEGVRGASRATRILTLDLATKRTREFLYLLDGPSSIGNSEIAALSQTRFLVLERDVYFRSGEPAAAQKKVYAIDLTGATDIGPLGALGATLPSGKTIEQSTPAELTTAGIVAVSKTLSVDLLSLGYPHDKPEGLAVGAGGMLFVVNDDDFGVADAGGGLVAKLLPPANVPDYVSIWQIRVR